MDINMFDEEEMVNLPPTTCKMPGLSSTPQVGTSHIKRIPFPGNYVDGKFEIQYADIEDSRKPVLVDMCKGFNLPHSGNMATLRKRLRDFSGDQNKWDELHGRSTRSHLGPRPSHLSKTKNPTQKKSAIRRDKMFENDNTLTAQRLPSILSTVVPEQRWDETQHIADMKWAVAIMNMYPYQKENTRMEIAERNAVRRSSSSPVASDQTIIEGFETVHTRLDQLLEAVQLPLKPGAGTLHLQDSTSIKADQQTAQRNSHELSISSPILPESKKLSPLDSSQTRTLVLGNGQKITFTAADVPPPPVVSFAHNLPGLNCMWDDTSKFWNGVSVLHINDVPIPLVYWKDVYTSKIGSGWKPDQWKATKGKWFDWKVLVECWRKDTPDQFWSRFTKDGKKLGYKAILKELAAERKKNEECYANMIRLEYGREFDSTFCYSKNGTTYVKVKACDIIKQYRRIKGVADLIDSDDDDE